MNKKTIRIKESLGDRIFITAIYIFLIAVLVIVLYPLIYIVSASFSSTSAVISGRVWLWPVEPTLLGYKTVFQNPQILQGFSNSLFYTVVGTFISVSMTIMLAYPLSRKTFYGRNFIMVLLVFTMIFDGGLIPLYLVVKNLQMIDTIWSILLPQALVVFQVIIARTFFQSTIPDELVEASEMDGCSDIGFIWKVVLPLSKPIIAVLVLMYAVMKWNMYFDAMIYLKSEELFPLQLILRSILILNQESSSGNIEQMLKLQGLKELMKYSLIVISSVPVLILYPFVQKHFVKGVMIGSVKG
ncbi:carbohydrate ABC transporter permease [Lederbergia galactosidilytica]|uniref:Sugar ABC transporter permease n=1 Tax=Lederbergia galactosidilytica TaxID=217031 RepID=A0A0Q9Y8P7_9BACI|nr:carbohydrate ABC transporter permease [Lederbergia galactosidilytica]KRG11987.1 sugar ABC transporter permease [Lederbergia galactosidilytica]KRG15440.1 sugar ABC transporter permease [Virgibacillus soli]MBP1916218.1 putative aldouronate transport system permease protein [Lederbergia galactosidilytica]OAK75851.1 sugar ABC transporter permease [Lederbergia galactosidilytica]